jgi:hypothetical protein
LLATSVDNGWSHSDSAIAATYRDALDDASLRTLSNISVTSSVSGQAVGGKLGLHKTGVDKKGHDIIDAATMEWNADRPLDPELGPFNVVINAHSLGQDPGQADSVTNLSFRVDNQAPLAPTVESLANAAYGSADPLAIVTNVTDPRVAGVAPDNVSGISALVLHFYNPVAKAAGGDVRVSAGPPPSSTIGSEVTSLRQTIAITCSVQPYCPNQLNHFSKTSTPAELSLTAGLWAIRVSAVDNAGNSSGESSALQFVVIPGASAPSVPH